jgi:hypothetical protein
MDVLKLLCEILKSIIERGDKMLNGVLTRWELTSENRFENFLEELVKYLKTKLVSVKLSNGEIIWECNFNHGDYMDGYIYVDTFWYSKNFCSQSKYLWEEVLEMIIEYTGNMPMCDCDIVEDVEFIYKYKNSNYQAQTKNYDKP